jgi:hypothetical protein
MPFELSRDRRRIDDGIPPVVQRDSLGEELRAQTVTLACDGVDGQRQAR